MIDLVLSGETGENPVRARRRKAYTKHCYPSIEGVLTQSHKLGKSHWILSEKAG